MVAWHTKKDSPKYLVINGIFKLTELRNMYRFFYYFLRFKKFCFFFFNLRVTCVWNTRQKRGFLSVSVCCQQDAGHVRNPLCLRKIKETEYFYIFILTSTSLAAFNPTIRAFRTEISKHLPAKPGFFLASFTTASGGYYQTDMYF